MIILAGAIILSLNSTNIFDRAEEAVNKTDMAQIQHIVQLAWADTYLDKDGKATEEELREGINKALRANNLEPDDYNIIVTEKGVETVTKGWIQKGYKLIRNDQEVEIGDVISYTATGSNYTGRWKILGIDENGDLLIMSTKQVGKTSSPPIMSKAYLDDFCKPYGNGVGTVGNARSIMVEDINKFTGYVPTESNKTWTFKYNGTTRPNYEYYIGEELKSSGKIINNCETSGFEYYDGTKVQNISPAELKNSANDGKTITTSTVNIYGYTVSDYLDDEEDEKVFDMLCLNDNTAKTNARYLMASSTIFVEGSEGGLHYKLPIMGILGEPKVDMWSHRATGGWTGSESFEVRAVVTLQADITVSGSSAAGWTYTVD